MTDPGQAPDPAPAAKITVALLKRPAADLEAIAGRTGMSKTDIVNRAIRLYELIDAETTCGGRIVLERPDGTQLQIELL